MVDKIDKYWLGILAGLLMPAVFVYCYIDRFNLWSSLHMFGMALSGTWSKLFMLSVFPNMAFVFVFYTIEAWRFSKGLIIGAMPYLITSIFFTL